MPFIVTNTLLILFLLLFSQGAWSQAEFDSSEGSVFPLKEHIISHPSIKTESISLNELREIFSLRARTWPDGTPIQVFVMRDESDVHRQFLQRCLKMLPHQLRRHWDRYIYSGIGQGPTIVDTPADMLKKIKKTPGSIGYIPGGMADEAVHLLSIH